MFLMSISLLPGDLVLADRGFNIADSLGTHYASLWIPAFTKGKDQLKLETLQMCAYLWKG